MTIRARSAAAILFAFGTAHAVAQGCDWQPLDTGVGPAADACAVLTNGDVVYGGRFSLAGSTEVEYVARWDGKYWQPMGTGFNNFVRALLALPDGSVIAGGHFTFGSQSRPSNLIARWDGLAWRRMGDGLDAGSVRALARTQSGDIIAGGSFLQAENLPAWGVARWNGSSWSKVGNNTAGGGIAGYLTPEPSPTMVNSIVEMPNGDIIVGGNFSSADGVGATGIARWDGTNWNPLGQGTSHVVRDMVVLDNGDLLVTGIFGSAGGMQVNGLARWDGTNWHPMGDGITGTNSSSPFSIEKLPTGEVVLAGAFNSVDNVAVNNVAMWDPTTDTWSPLGTGFLAAIQTSVLDLDIAPDGTIFAAGQFASAGGTTLAKNAAVYTCARECIADVNHDGILTPADFSAWVGAFNDNVPECDQNGDGLCSPADFSAWVANYNAGC
ncbi:MAG: hypothetical protein KDA31_02235 [Phycisphaerales bacterium]|nr:hypothetical protein [Phycisphaerales bacterium]MCB9835649.1 hypothetical protein [Phycisphaera sp.]